MERARMRSEGDPDSLGKPYAEAFPQIDIHDLERASGEAESEFYQWVDEDGLIIGHIAVDELTSAHLRFHYRFFGTRNIEAGTGAMMVRIVRKKTGTHWIKPSFQCPTCGCDRSKLFYLRGAWMCKTCHGLLNLAQRLSPVNKAHWQHNTALERLKNLPTNAAERRKREKDKRIYGTAMRLLIENSHKTELPEHFRCRAMGRWLKADELPLLTIEPDSVGYGWGPGDRGQFSGLDTRERPKPPRAGSDAPERGGGVMAHKPAHSPANAAAHDRKPGEVSEGWAALRRERERRAADEASAGREPKTTDQPSFPRVIPWFGQW